MTPRARATLISPRITIAQAMKVIQEETHRSGDAPGNIALAVDGKKKLTGIVTDGDIRRAILKNISLKEPVTKILNTNPIVFNKNCAPEEILERTAAEIKKRNIANKRLDVIITVDDEGRPHDVFPFFELWKSAEVKTRVVSIIGLGYVGLTLGLTLADLGFNVVGIDRDKTVLSTLRRKKSHVHEKGIDDLLSRHVGKNFTVAETSKENESDIYIVAVGTPVDGRGRVNTEALKKALTHLADVLKKDDLIILRSTVPMGTCRTLVVPLLEKKTGMKAGEDFSVAFAPERTVEGNALAELRSLPQVIGGLDRRSIDLTVKLFRYLTDAIVLTDSLEAAEMVKLLNNTYRDLTFSFANEVALVCDKFGLNSAKVIKAANYGYSRSLIPRPSSGTGGYCLTKDPLIYAESARSVGIHAKLPLASRAINSAMPEYVADKVDAFVKHHGKKPGNVRIFIVGLAFKGNPETSDMRGSPSLAVFDILKKRYKKIIGYDPVVSRKDIERHGLLYETLPKGFAQADCVLVLNDHPSYKDLPIHRLLSTMKKPALFFDGWHLFDDILTEPIPGIEHQST